MTSIGTMHVGLRLDDKQFQAAVGQVMDRLQQLKRQGSGPLANLVPTQLSSQIQALGRDLAGDLVKGVALFGSATRDANKYLMGFAGSLGSLFGPAGLIATAVIAVGALTAGIVKLAEASRDARFDKLQEAQRIIAEINGQEFRLSEDLMTSAQAGEHLSKTLSQISEAFVERTIGFGFREMKLGLASLAESAANFFLGEEALAEIRRRDAEAQAALERARKLKEEAEQRRREAEERRRREEQEIAEMHREIERAVQEMQRKADDLRRSLRTPMEELRDDVEEARRLLSGGFIDQATFDRATQRWAERIRQLKSEQVEPPSSREITRAVVGGTAADLSVRLRMQEESRRETALAEQQVRLTEEILAELKKLNLSTEGLEIVTL